MTQKFASHSETGYYYDSRFFAALQRIPTITAEAAGVNAVTSAVTTLTSAATPTKGAWVQLIASTATRTFFLILTAEVYTNQNDDYHIDIGTGAAGSESVKVSNIPFSPLSTVGCAPVTYGIFLTIPAGTRIAARCTSNLINRTIGVAIYLVEAITDPPFRAPANQETSNATPSNITVTAHANANTKGSWTQLIASTTKTTVAMLVEIRHWQSDAALGFLLDIGIGAATSETVLIPNLRYYMISQVSNVGTVTYFFPFVNIATGTRIAARCQATEGGHDVGVAIHLFESA